MDKTTGDPTDPTWFRRVLGQYPTGVCVVTATESDGRRAGFVVGSFTSVSMNPPLVAFFPDKGSTSWPRIHDVGSFCVNILGAGQEYVCRNFASRKEDKFAGIAFREAESGSPIITEAVAWIDCDLESVTEAGDHYIVLGRVRSLDVESSALPLLFFQGGYGRFSPLSLAADGSGLVKQLRDVDLVRAEMEAIAADLPGTRCNASALVDDEIVVLASAGALGSAQATFVGERLPFMPPLGRVFAAWMNERQVGNWLKHLSSEEERRNEHEVLAAVRSRGFSAIRRTDAWQELEAARASLAADPTAVDRADLHGKIRQLDHEVVALSPEVKTDIGVIRVPVFAPDGTVAMQLSVYGLATETDAVEASIERIRVAGRRATERLGGHLPATP
jgi:flavin reductase (DIM6/NTAB) family NADH-FMN oxidoreductase RutF/DNA-binding IclR family transcriptional regulator